MNEWELDSDDLSKEPSIRSKALVFNKRLSTTFVKYFIHETTDVIPDEAALLIRWFITPGGMRDEDERDINDISIKLKVDKKLLFDIFRSERFKSETSNLLTEFGLDHILRKMIMDVVVARALAGNLTAAKMLMPELSAKAAAPSRAPSKKLTEMTDAELEAFVSNDRSA